MSGISSGIGLISGIDTASLIDQLIAIERRPVETLQTRVGVIDIQRAAFMELSARLLSVQNAITGFGRSSFFKRFTSASTNESVLTADAGDTAAPGSYTFRVRSLVTNHSLMSRGLADADTTPIGIGRLAIEMGHGRVNKSTELDAINGGAGVRHGVITITDRSGASADIDLTTALSIDDVLKAINSNPTINVRASVTGVASHGATGDRIVVEDLSTENADGDLGNLIITDKESGWTAADLGIAVNAAVDRVDGHDLVRLSPSTSLTMLNDGNGVGRFRSGTDLKFSTAFGDFTVSLTNILATQLDTDLRMLNSGNGVRPGTIQITDRSGQSARIDLSGARSVRDVIDAINAADVSVSATVIQINEDSFFQITDTSGIPSDAENADKLKIEDVSGFAAADLGIAGEVDGESIQGHDIYRIETIGDVINAINFASGNNSFVEASISEGGNGIVLRALGLGNTLTVTAGSDESGVVSTAARDLGLLGADGVATYESRHVLAGLNTVLLHSLNGGGGVEVGEVRLTDRAGRTTTIDFSNAHTLQDVIDLINLDDATSLAASVNTAGNGIVLRDESGGSGHVIIEDVSGTLTADLGIAGLFTNDDGDVIDGGNLQVQYISRQTLLSDLNGGRGVTLGTFQVTDSNGAIHPVVLNDTVKTIGDVIDAINHAVPDTIEARINDTGDGIVVIDTSGGSLPLAIEDRDGGRAAEDLRLVGTARTGENFVDGSFETRIDIDADDTLEAIAKKINEAAAGLTASVLNHGGTINPYSLTITSEVSGRRGELVIDSVGVELGLTTISRPQDAVIVIGDETSTNPLVVSSPTNTMEGVVEGVTLNLLSVDDEPVTVTIAQDIDGIVESIKTFVEKFNDVLNTIDENTSFNSDTLERGPLFGDRTVDLVRTRLLRAMMKRFEGVDESVLGLFSVGIRLGEGNRLTFDEERFHNVYGESPQLVEQLFTEENTGVAAVLQEMFEELTRDFDGVITRKDDLLSNQQELLNDRIDGLNVLLDAKRARLEAQFVALESSLAALQAQQNALVALAEMSGG